LSLLQRVGDLRLIVFVKLISKFFRVFDGVAHLVHVVLELVLRVQLFLNFFVLVSKLFGFFDHSINLLLGQAAFVVCDGNGL